MHPTPFLAAAIVGLLAAHPCPSLDAQSDPDRTVVGGGAAELDVRGLVWYRVNHNLDVQIGTLEVHGQ